MNSKFIKICDNCGEYFCGECSDAESYSLYCCKECQYEKENEEE